MNRAIVFMALSFMLFATSLTVGQGTRITFAREIEPFSTPAGYTWRQSEGNFPTTVTSPGGTAVQSFGSATFATPEEFLADIIGTWTVTNPAGAISQFDMPEFNDSNFIDVELILPYDGRHVLEFESVDIEASPASFNFAVSTPTGSFVENVSQGSFSIGLDDGVDQVEARTFAIVNEFRTDIVSNIRGDLNELPINPEVRISSTSPTASVFVSRSPSFLGDVNRDGSLDLLDVQPFVDLLANVQFQVEGDINQDGNVDLLDIAPFVNLF